MNPQDVEFHARVRNADSRSALGRIAVDFCRAAAFDYYVMGLQFLRRGGKAERLLLGNFPDAWSNEYLQNGYVCFDPVIEHALRSSEAIFWSEVVPETCDQKRIMRRAIAHGLIEGVSVPLYLPGNVFGVTSFVRTEPIEAEEEQRFELKRRCQWFAQLSANRLLELELEAHRDRAPHLTAREQEAVKYACDGLSVPEIAKRMQISVATVRFFFAQAGKKLGARGRSEIVAIANSSGVVNRHRIEFRTAVTRGARNRGRMERRGGAGERQAGDGGR